MKGTLDTIVLQSHDFRKNDPKWLASLRKEAVDIIRDKGFPSVRHEEWKYTSLEDMYRSELHLPNEEENRLTENDIETKTLAKNTKCKAIFLNGRFSKSLSKISNSPNKLKLTLFSHLLKNESESLKKVLRNTPNEAFTSLNTALMDEGLLIESQNNSTESDLVHVINISAGNLNTITTPRIAIKSNANSKLTVIEEFIDFSDGESFTNAVTIIEAAQGSEIQHHRITNNRNSYHVGHLKCLVNKDANLISSSLALGGKVSRINIDAQLNETGASCHLTGLFIGMNEETIDHHTSVEHAASNTFSDEVYKGVMGGKSKGVFNGKVVVNKNISGVKASQNSNNLLLSEIADINTKPELEIYSDDVRCAHGATVGELDSDSIFYLRARGISEKDARQMLVEAFIDDALSKIPVPSVQDEVKKIIRTARINEANIK